MYIGSAIDIGFFLVINIGYRKNIKNDVGTPLLVVTTVLGNLKAANVV